MIIQKKVPFTLERWLENQDEKVYNEDGIRIIIKSMAIDEILERMNNKDLFFIEEVDDRADYLVKKVSVSNKAKEFQKKPDYYKEPVIKCAEWFMGLVGYFNHYAFFTKELWRKVKGFEKADEAEIKIMFIQWWFRTEYGFQTQPVGCGWCGTFKSYEDEDPLFEDYIERYRPILQAFTDWCNSQR